MSQLLVIALIVVVAIVLIAIAVVIARKVGQTRLRPLPDESRDRYARMWPSIEARFIEEPGAAVQEADKVVVMILSERGANLTDGQRMPEDLRKARSATRGDQGRRDTEAMRRAMVSYKAIVDAAVGSSRIAPEARQREMAS
ncbi:MAG: hypothetical protein E6I61_05675 [Chloroflexi bacterium]|nr:MAG: hypothetical protein E6J08_01795 [Chloroflexota bacterium]TME04295.1 MAG: hypothetical protein E6I71_07340 [Chloroflexota bacterium]TME41634.1 MAG: hypothetical protein E6I61_05675 [Chloroflexota bacterium]TME51495.1 MAG: hypothetical protein E6I53_09830 [Chloroflexota bacterium]